MLAKLVSVVVLVSVILTGCGGTKSLPEGAKAAISAGAKDYSSDGQCDMPQWEVKSARKVAERYGRILGLVIWDEAWCVVIDPPLKCENGHGYLKDKSHFFLSRTEENWTGKVLADESESERETWFEENGCNNW